MAPATASEWHKRLTSAAMHAAKIGAAGDEQCMRDVATKLGWVVDLEMPYANGTGMLFARDVCGRRVQASFRTLHGRTVWLQLQLCTPHGRVTYLPGGTPDQGVAQAFGVTYAPAVDCFVPPEALCESDRSACIGMARVFRDAQAGKLARFDMWAGRRVRARTV